jgi:hypothetical protein
MSREIIQSVAYDNYDDFQHFNFTFSQIFIVLFWGLFNEETDWPWGKVVNLGMFRCKVKAQEWGHYQNKGPCKVTNGVLPNFSNAFAHGALLSMKSNLTFDLA